MLKIAIVHEWFDVYAGSEKVVEEILKIFPESDLYSLVDFVEDKNRGFILNKSINTSFIQRLPFSKKKFRNYLPLMPLAIEQFDLSKYDVIISSSHAVAKGVITGPDQVHISYVHSPIRYAWDLQHQYLKESSLDKGLKGMITKYILFKIRNWDYRTSNGVDYFIANSDFIGKRIYKVYRRESKTIYPPVDVSGFSYHSKKEDFYLTASRIVPYKKMDIIIKAFSKMPDKKLIVIGEGTELEKIKKGATNNITFLGYQPFDVLKEHMQRAKAFVFASKEDFGITPVEAQACGTPVIAFGEGGALETVNGIDSEEPTGLFFYEQTPQAIINAVEEFENSKNKISPEYCRSNAEKFSAERFRNEFQNFVYDKMKSKTNISNEC